MSQYALDEARRRRANAEVDRAIQLLCAAGTCLVGARKYLGDNAAANDLVTALRDDIKTMVGDVEAVRDVIHGR